MPIWFAEENTLKKESQEMEEWEKHYIANKDKTIEEIYDNQIQTLEKTLQSLKSHFPPVFLPIVKKAEGEKLEESELTQIRNHKDSRELSARIRGLRKVFKTDYYEALDKVIGGNVLVRKENYVGQVEPVHTSSASPSEESFQTVDSGGHTRKLPKGFAKWDLKQIKLHESQAENEEPKWTDYWTLKGETAVGEILFNGSKIVYYFRPYDTEKFSTFALTSENGRKLTREARNYYFRSSPTPPA